MMLKPTSGRQGFDFVVNSSSVGVTKEEEQLSSTDSSTRMEMNLSSTNENSSKSIDSQKQEKIIHQTTEVINQLQPK